MIKEATGHKADNIVELAELGVAIWSGRVASKRAASKAAGRIAGEAEKVSEGLQKLRGFKKIKFKTRRLVRKFLPKKRYRKMAVVDVEELAKKQGLKPNLQLFAEEGTSEGITVNLANKGVSFGRHIPQNLFEQMAMKEVLSNPLKNAIDLSKISKPIILNDSRWPSCEGWVKMQRIVIGSNGEKAIIHFVYNDTLKLFDDFKFV